MKLRFDLAFFSFKLKFDYAWGQFTEENSMGGHSSWRNSPRTYRCLSLQFIKLINNNLLSLSFIKLVKDISHYRHKRN